MLTALSGLDSPLGTAFEEHVDEVGWHPADGAITLVDGAQPDRTRGELANGQGGE